MSRLPIQATLLASCVFLALAAPVGASDAKDKVEAQKLARQLSDRDELEVERALGGLRKLGEAGTEPLIKATNDSRTWVRVGAWKCLAAIPSAASRMRPVLLAKLRAAFPDADGTPWELGRDLHMLTMVSASMVFTARVLAPKPKTSKDKKLLEDAENASEPIALLAALESMAMADHAAFLKELDLEMPADPASGFSVLRRVHARAAAGVGFGYFDLTRDLASKESAVIRGALMTASNYKDAKTIHAAAITAHLDSTDAFVRAEALMALVALDADLQPQRAKLEALLQDPDPFVRLQSARALIHCAAAMDSGFKHLESARADEKPAIRRWAVQELGLLALETKVYHPETNVNPTRALRFQYVVAALADPAPEVRKAALEAVVRFKAEAKSALTEVKRLTRDKDPGVVQVAKAAVEKIES